MCALPIPAALCLIRDKDVSRDQEGKGEVYELKKKKKRQSVSSDSTPVENPVPCASLTYRAHSLWFPTFHPNWVSLDNTFF